MEVAKDDALAANDRSPPMLPVHAVRSIGNSGLDAVVDQPLGVWPVSEDEWLVGWADPSGGDPQRHG